MESGADQKPGPSQLSDAAGSEPSSQRFKQASPPRLRTLFFAEALKKTQHEFNADRRLANDREGGKGKRRQLKMAITWRGSIALRGNLSSRKGRARRVDLQCPGDFFRARCPPGCLPPAPKLRTYDRGRPAGGTTAVGARGSAPGPRASRGTLAIKTGGLAGHFGGMLRNCR